MIVDLRKEMSNLKKEIAPVKQDLAERKKKELDEEQSYEKVKTKSWWYY